MFWNAKLSKINSMVERLEEKIWVNSLQCSSGDLLRMDNGYLNLAWPWDVIEWVALDNVTFPPNNITWPKYTIKYRHVMEFVYYEMPVTWGSLIASMVWWYFDMDVNQTVDFATYNTSSWQLRLETITDTVTGTRGLFTIMFFGLWAWPAWPAWPQGATGQLWPTGVSGATWPLWPIGATWPMWPWGTGTTGATWPVWPTGIDGATGATWPIWATGVSWTWFTVIENNVSSYWANTQEYIKNNYAVWNATITLPTAVWNIWLQIWVKKTNNTWFNTIVQWTGWQTLDGSVNQTITIYLNSVIFMSDWVNRIII